MNKVDYLQAHIIALQNAFGALVSTHPDRAHLMKVMQLGANMAMAHLLASGRSETFVQATQEAIDLYMVIAKGDT